MYTLSAWISSGGGFNQSYMYAKNTGRAEAKINIPVSSSSWTQISLPVVIENNSITIGFYADGPADKWIGVDLISLVKNEEIEPDPVGVTIGNYSFEADGKSQEIQSWTEDGDKTASFTDAPGYSSSYSLTHYSDSDYKVTTYQTLSGLENGYYTLTAWSQNSGGQRASYLFARDNGTSEARAALPIGSKWTKVYLRGIHVTNGTATIGLFSDAKAGRWAKLDRVELVKDDNPYRLLKGGDVSELTYVESQGGKFYDHDGNEKDLFQILKENGHDIVRLRVYNEPGKGHGNDGYYRPAGIMDKEDILKLAKRAKAAGLQIQLTFHYSDYWTNGATHNIPNAWQAAIKDLTSDEEKVNELGKLLYAYTLDVMSAMVDQGTTPEFVSLGNEMQSGILFPYGRASADNWTNLASFLKAGAAAVREVSPKSKIILHLDDAGNTAKYESFFNEIVKREVDYDIIGPSYYPYWTDKTIEQIVEFCNYFSKKYDKDIMIMETGYNWNPTLPNGTIGQLNDNGPYPADTSSPQGQKEFMINLFNGLKSVDNGRVIGDLYWDPIMIAVPGVGWAIKEIDDEPDLNVVSNTTLFDFDGKALPSHDAYKLNTEGTALGHISGVVRGSLGKSIAGATITAAIDGSTITTKSDGAGNYFIPDLAVDAVYTITASKNGYQSGHITVNLMKAGQFTSNQNIVLTGGSITGTVKDQNSKPAADVKVSTMIDGADYSSFTNQEGQYTLADLPAVSGVKVTAVKDGYAPGETSGVAVSIGTNTPAIDLSIVLNSGTITGKVIGNDQSPIAGATVSVNAGGRIYSALSDTAGEYTLVNVPAGAGYTVIAVKQGYLKGESSGIAVTVGGITNQVQLVLMRNVGLITGVVTDSSNAPVEGATVRAVKADHTYTAVTDAQGKYVLEDVLGDSGYLITASKAGYLNGSAASINVKAFTTTSVNLKLPTIIPLINASFESQGAKRNIIPGWTISGTEDATFIQKHDNAVDGSYVFSHWLDKAYTSDAYQTITGLANGYYTVTAWFYNGGDQKEYYMYAKDSSGMLARFDVPKTSSMKAYSMDVKVEHGELTIGFYADAYAGNWALIDAVTLGYLGALPTTPVTSAPTSAPAVQTVKIDLKQGARNENNHTITVSALPSAGASGIIIDIAAQQLAEAAAGALQVIIRTGLATISLAPELFKDIITTASSSVQLSVTKVDSSLLPSDVQKAIGTNAVYDFNLTVDGVKVPQFGRNMVKVELPYTLRQGEEPLHVVVYYINDEGKLEVVKNASYQLENASVLFSPSHFSKYAAIYKETVFHDISGAAWAQQSISFLAARGIINGFSDQTFKPGDAVTRAQFIQMLMGLLDISGDGASSTFTDVKEDAWYASAIASAQKLGIVNGKNNGSFGVNDEISREEMAVILYRAAKAVNAKLDKHASTEAFHDAAQISAYAAEAVSEMQQAGLVNGIGGGAFAPKGHATRAQAAVILERLFHIVHDVN